MPLTRVTIIGWAKENEKRVFERRTRFKLDTVTQFLRASANALSSKQGRARFAAHVCSESFCFVYALNSVLLPR